MSLSIVIVLLVCLLDSLKASAGDRSGVFNTCLTRCLKDFCNITTSSWDRWNPLSDWLHDLVEWKCDRNCKYQCMWETVDAFKRDNLSLPQFYGKWPFIRIWGIEEPASAFFSLLNLIFTLWTLRRFLYAIPQSLPMRKYWLMGCVKMDYFCALANILASIVICHGRVFHEPKCLHRLFLVAVVVFFVWHVYSMTYYEFDYGYNIFVAVTFGLIVCFTWLAWSYLSCDPIRQPYVKYVRLYVFLLVISALLELNDFTPIAWFLDAHALWHASTIYVIWPWYKFILADARYQYRQMHRVDKTRINV